MLRYSPDADRLAGALLDDDGESVIRFWDAETFDVAFDVPVPERVRDLDFSPDGSLLAVASRLATSVIDVEARSVLYTFDQEIEPFGLDPRPSTISFTVDGGHVAVGWDDGRLELWQLPGADELVVPEREPCDPVPVPGDVLFDTGSASLRNQADSVLAELAEQLAANFPEATLTFVGHTDSRGSADANQQLSLDRATATRDWFASWADDNSIEGWTFDVDGRGDTQLRSPTSTPMVTSCPTPVRSTDGSRSSSPLPAAPDQGCRGRSAKTPARSMGSEVFRSRSTITRIRSPAIATCEGRCGPRHCPRRADRVVRAARPTGSDHRPRSTACAGPHRFRGSWCRSLRL